VAGRERVGQVAADGAPGQGCTWRDWPHSRCDAECSDPGSVQYRPGPYAPRPAAYMRALHEGVRAMAELRRDAPWPWGGVQHHG
jgi:hypothetical protein